MFIFSFLLKLETLKTQSRPPVQFQREEWTTPSFERCECQAWHHKGLVSKRELNQHEPPGNCAKQNKNFEFVIDRQVCWKMRGKFANKGPYIYSSWNDRSCFLFPMIILLLAVSIDLNWFCFQVRVNRNKQRGVLSVDGRYSKQMMSPKRVKLLFFCHTFIFPGKCFYPAADTNFYHHVTVQQRKKMFFSFTDFFPVLTRLTCWTWWEWCTSAGSLRTSPLRG